MPAIFFTPDYKNQCGMLSQGNNDLLTLIKITCWPSARLLGVFPGLGLPAGGHTYSPLWGECGKGRRQGGFGEGDLLAVLGDALFTEKGKG